MQRIIFSEQKRRCDKRVGSRFLEINGTCRSR